MNSGGTSTFQDPYVGPYDSYDQELSNDMWYVGVGLVPGIDYVIPYQPYGRYVQKGRCSRYIIRVHLNTSRAIDIRSEQGNQYESQERS